MADDLKKQYERETGKDAYISEPGRVGCWACSDYVAWLEKRCAEVCAGLADVGRQLDELVGESQRSTSRLCALRNRVTWYEGRAGGADGGGQG